MKKFSLMLTVLFLSLMFVSCGGSSGDGGGSRQEETVDCMSATQETDLRAFLNRVSQIPVIEGIGTFRVFPENSPIILTETYDLVSNGEDTWTMTNIYCFSSEECDSDVYPMKIQDGCFYNYDRDLLKEVISVSASFLITSSIQKDPNAPADTIQVEETTIIQPSNKIKINNKVFRNERLIQSYSFESF